MAGLSDSSYLAGGSQPQQQPRILTLRPLVVKRERFRFCSCPKMAKVTLFVILAVLVALVAISAFADPQNDPAQPRSRARSKLSSVRKKKPSLSKPTTTLLPMVEDSSPEIPQVLTSSLEIIGTETADATEPTTTQSTKPKKVSPRANGNSSPRILVGAVPEGCGECDLEECSTPSDNSCATGLVLDRCSCCYVCGVGEGHRCYNSSLYLPYNPDVGICGAGMSCLLRSDLDPSEPREALCECRDRRVVCGSDQTTYLSECRLSEAAHSKPGLTVRSWSPCVQVPVITTPVENITSPSGADVSMNCEVRGFPAPVLHWEFLPEGSNGSPLILPGDDSGVVIVVRGGPEQMMTTSWIQIISVNPKRQGTYYCVAMNSEGKIQSSAAVTVYKGSDRDDEDE